MGPPISLLSEGLLRVVAFRESPWGNFDALPLGRWASGPGMASWRF
jgi:hypothetical protein